MENSKFQVSPLPSARCKRIGYVTFRIFPRIITILRFPPFRAGKIHTRARSKFITGRLALNNKIESLALAMPAVRILRMPSVYRVAVYFDTLVCIIPAQWNSQFNLDGGQIVRGRPGYRIPETMERTRLRRRNATRASYRDGY